MSSKWFLTSRTLWLNGAVALLGYVQGGVNAGDVSGVMDSLGMGSVAIAGFNMALRFFKTHEAVGRGGKSILASWTFWFNLCLVLLGLYVMFGQDVATVSQDSAAAAIGLMLYGAANIALRRRTDQSVRLLPIEIR